METWFCLWNPKRWKWPAEESRLTREGTTFEESWKFSNRNPKKGDRVFVKRTQGDDVGDWPNGYIAAGHIAKDGTFEVQGDEGTEVHAMVEFDWVLENVDEPLRVSELEKALPGVNWEPQSSGCRITGADPYKTELMWARKIGAEHDVLNLIKAHPAVNPATHDPAYELIDKAVEIYSRHEDLSFVGFGDINFVYMTVHIISDESRKVYLSKTNLPEAEKREMSEFIDACLEKVKQGFYGNRNPEQNYGLFLPGFRTFDRKSPSADLPRLLIGLLIKVREAGSRAEAIDAIEKSGILEVKGIAAPSFSEMAHCLRPDDLPIANGNQDLPKVWPFLIPGTKKIIGKTSEYVKLCRSACSLKDRAFPDKNFRVVDLVQREMTEGKPIDFQAITTVMKKHTGDPWRKSSDGLSPADARALSELNSDLSVAKKECKRLIAYIEERFGLKSTRDVNFKKNEYSSVRHIRDYVWLEFKDPEMTDSPISVSVFPKSIGGKGGKMAVSVQLEIYDEGAKKKPSEWTRFHRHLDLPLNIGAGLSYSVGSNQYSNVEELNQQVAEIRSQLADGALKKVAIIKAISVEPPAMNEESGSEVMAAIEAILPYYEYCVGLGDGTIPIQQPANTKQGGSVMPSEKKIGLNTILYGPPGTGKTYNAIIWAVAICEGKTVGDVSSEPYSDVKTRYDTLLKQGRIAFTTFHQSYGYEDFIEGIKPKTLNGSVAYDTLPGLFKAFCEKARTPATKGATIDIPEGASIWKFTLKTGKMNPIKRECFDEGYVRANFSEEDDMGREFAERFNVGDVVLSLRTNESIDAIGIVEGELETLDAKPDFKLARKVRWLVKEIEEPVREYNGGKLLPIATFNKLPNFRMEDVLAIIKKHDPSFDASVEEKKPFVFVIDEINRGNISKIFGELITLIEESKREGADEAMSATLPYSCEDFSVPSNVYILGTMNTADRSIALMDTALRRRFQFVEMMPDAQVLRDEGCDKVSFDGKEFDVAAALEAMNRRIEVLYDREHTLGHALFMGLKKEPTLEKLSSIFHDSIIPLLQEYFYEDYEKIQLVLGDNAKPENLKFVRDIENKPTEVFRGNSGDQDIPEKRYEIQESAFYAIESYIEIVG